MENRERDRVSQRSTPTEAGGINRHVEEERGRQQNSGTSAEFGQNIGRSENLEGGNVNNKQNSNLDSNRSSNLDRESESTRRPNSDYSSSTGRSGSVGNMGGGGSDIDSSRSGSSSNKTDRSSGSEFNDDMSSGRH